MLNKPKIINGYKLTEKLGKGSYAQVFKCTKIATGEILAMKIFKELKANTQKIKQQVEIVKKLDHPNIIKCSDYFVEGQDNGKLYAVFQYCSKGTLKQYTDEQKQEKLKIPEIYAKSLIWKILDALIYLHERKIAHRDLKLDNILINEELDIKLADFGLSKSYEEGSVLDTLCGTPLTMAPQVMKNQAYTQKCDTWSFGVISYYLLCLDYPFYANKLTELKKVILSQKVPKFPKDFQISQQAQDFIKKCLTIDPQKRPRIEELKSDPWFIEIPQSKIRIGGMKESMGQSSEIINRTKDVIKNSIKTEIDKIILSTNLFQKRINEIIKGFQEFYPKQKMNLLYFYIFSVHKVTEMTKRNIDVKIFNQNFQVPNQQIQKFSKHMKHVIELFQSKKTELKNLTKQIDPKKCQKSDQNLYKFVILQSSKIIEEDQKFSQKHLKFFINLLNFLNTKLIKTSIEIKLAKNSLDAGTVEEIDIYLRNILTVEKILKIVNQDESEIDLGSNIQKKQVQIWTVEYINLMKQAKDQDTWGLTGEAVQRALITKKLIDYPEQ